jgi:endogenous inhibitor of DNA gyrase (YacG/DUF329 family)
MAEKQVTVRCPRCGELVPWEKNPYRPFCSERCKLIDLGKWIEEEYRIAGEKQMPKKKKEGRGG